MSERDLDGDKLRGLVQKLTRASLDEDNYGANARDLFDQAATTTLTLLDAIAALRARAEQAEADAERLDKIESCIRDGSYLSIFNDIIAACQHAYATFGTGPALRTAIDGAFAAIDRARSQGSK